MKAKKEIGKDLLGQQLGLRNQPESKLSSLPRLHSSGLLIENRNIPFLSLAYELDENLQLLEGAESKNSRVFFEINSLIRIHDIDLGVEASEDSLVRRNTESNWYTWGVKAQIGYQLTKSVFIKSGIDFIESRNKFDFRSEFLLPSSTQFSSTAFRFFSVGDLSYRQFNIPLTIGLEKANGKLIYGLEGTALLNFSFRAEGKIQTGSESISRVENLDIYKSSLGLG